MDDPTTDRRRVRTELLARREALPAADRARADAAIGAALAALLGLDDPAGAAVADPSRARPVLGFCWPHRGEYDARALAARWVAGGGTAALPVVAARAAPLVFRAWSPGTPMVDGDHGIAVPRPDVPARPDLLLVPLVGFDDAGYRLGYGGGYFDRTLAQPGAPRPIGVGYEWSRLPTITPQAHDIALPVVVTDAGVFVRDGGRLAAAAPADARRRLGLP